jgi:hypothetical protein
MTPGKIFIILVSTLVAGIAVALIFVACAAMAQERHRGDFDRGGHGGGYGGQRHYYSSRQPGYRYDPGRGWYNPSAAIGGAIGSYLWRQWNQPAEPVRTVAWCLNRYRSYDPVNHVYLGFDGQYHDCP